MGERNRKSPEKKRREEGRILKCKRCGRPVKEPALLAGMDYKPEQIGIICHYCSFEMEVFGEDIQ